MFGCQNLALSVSAPSGVLGRVALWRKYSLLLHYDGYRAALRPI
jgi:hypothetical protein